MTKIPICNIIHMGDEMIIHYDVDKINALLEDFYKATGVNIVLLKPDFSYVAGREHRENNTYCHLIQTSNTGAKSCKYSDELLLRECRDSKKMQMCKCPGGLWVVAKPLLYHDAIVGYIVFGEMKDDSGFSGQRDYIESLGLDVSLMEQHYAEITPFEAEKIKSIARVAGMLAKYIIMENMLKLDYDKNLDKAVTFINENLTEDLSIEMITQHIHVSKSVLYKKFRGNFDCTISEYINARRIEKAADLLLKSDLSIEEISKKTGFTSASYFSKTFKKMKGVSPLQYKKQS